MLQRQVLYTKPVTARAGEPVQVYYNPDNTVLRGRPETWLRGGWNRWTHAQAFPPQPMQPVLPGGVGFLEGTVQVQHASVNFQDLSCACSSKFQLTTSWLFPLEPGTSASTFAQAQRCACAVITCQDSSAQSARSPSLPLQCDVQVPEDAWSMDMVFSDSGDLQAAFYDNNSGVDYHVPVSGSSASPPRLRITHVSVEMAPIAKV